MHSLEHHNQTVFWAVIRCITHRQFAPSAIRDVFRNVLDYSYLCE